MHEQELLLNPFARLQPVEDVAGFAGYWVTAPVRDRGMVSTFVGYRQTKTKRGRIEPALVDLLRRLAAADDDVQLDADDSKHLAELGVLVEPSAVPRPIEYACTLERAREPAPLFDGSLVVNESLQVTDRLDAPDDHPAYAQILQRWSRQAAVAWVTDWRTGARYPYQLAADIAGVVRSLQPGQPAPPFGGELTSQLVAAEILVPADRTRQRHAWRAQIEDALACYRRNAYAIVRGIIPALHVAALRRYYAALIEEGFVQFGDEQVPRRYSRHSEEVMQFFHLQLRSFFAELVGAEIKPSYCFFASYRADAVLERHVDRPQCEYTVSLQVDFSPFSTGPCGWKLYVEDNLDPRETFAIDLGVGDCVIYRGRELAHYRHALPAGQSSTSFFLHYVPESFAEGLS